MYPLLLKSVVIFVTVLAVCASPASLLEQPRSVTSTILRPIKVGKDEAAIGLQRRSSEVFSDLDLQTQSELIYGSPGDGGQLLLANMTLYAPDGLLMIMLERFEGLTSAVDCKGDDGIMSLTFSSQDAFNHALQEWSYINKNDDGQFLLIANHGGCGPDDQRQPYLISKITEDTIALTTYLTAQTAPWSDVAGTYDIDFGQAIPYQKPQQLRERGFWGDIVNVGKDVLNAATGSADLSKSVNFPMNIGQQGQRTNIYTDDKGRLTLDCINCYVSGSFAVTGHVSVDHFSLQDLTLQGSPRGLQAALQLEATITSSDEPDSLQYTKELFSFPIPDAGIEVEGIFKLGAILSYDVGISSSFSGSATVDFGLQAGMPDSAQVTADIQNPDSSSATGWSGGSLTPLFDIKQESASIKLAAFSQPKLAFGIELIKIGNIDVALTVKLPEVSATLTAAYDEGGVCGAGSSKTGVKLDSEVDIGVDLQIDASLGEDTTKPSWSHTLYAYPIPLGSQCFPLDIPGLNSSSSATSVPPLPLSASQSIIYSAENSVSVTASGMGTMPGMTGTPLASPAAETPQSMGYPTGITAAIESSALGASTIGFSLQSGQVTDARPAPSDLPPTPFDDSGLASASATVTSGILPPVVTSAAGSSTRATLSAVADVISPNAKAKAIVVHSHFSSVLPSSSTPSFTSGIIPLPDVLGGDDVLAAMSPATTLVSSASISSSSTTLTPFARAGGDKKAAVEHPKTTATPTATKASTPPFKPKVPPTSTFPPLVDPAVRNKVEDLPPKPKVNPSAAPQDYSSVDKHNEVPTEPPAVLPPAEKLAPVVPTTTLKPIPAVTTTAPASGGGGCKMVKRFGKRMLIC